MPGSRTTWATKPQGSPDPTLSLNPLNALSPKSSIRTAESLCSSIVGLLRSKKASRLSQPEAPFLHIYRRLWPQDVQGSAPVRSDVRASLSDCNRGLPELLAQSCFSITDINGGLQACVGAQGVRAERDNGLPCVPEQQYAAPSSLALVPQTPDNLPSPTFKNAKLLTLRGDRLLKRASLQDNEPRVREGMQKRAAQAFGLKVRVKMGLSVRILSALSC